MKNINSILGDWVVHQIRIRIGALVVVGVVLLALTATLVSTMVLPWVVENREVICGLDGCSVSDFPRLMTTAWTVIAMALQLWLMYLLILLFPT